MGPEGANVLFDTWVHPLVMGLEEHLLAMFREDFEFHDDAGPSHLGGHATRAADAALVAQAPLSDAGPRPAAPAAAGGGSTPPDAGPTGDAAPVWAADAEKELKKIPFFVRGKARRNTETFAVECGIATITVETLYDAKAHFAR